MQVAIAALVGGVAAVALAQTGVFKRLEAQYSIATKDIVDPLPEDRPDRVILSITGQSAKEIYLAMPALGKRVSCDGQGDASLPPTKTAGGLECTGDDKKGYSCSVAIMLSTGKTDRGYVCD
jgi:hypothetical protein